METGGSKSARTRMRILNAAAHVLSRKGYAGTRLSDVADQAQLQAPAIYYYFPSREALVEEVMWTGIWLMREHVLQVLAALPPGTGPMERIDAAVAAHLRYALDISDYTTAAIRNAGQVPDDIRIRYSAEAAKYGEIWHALLHDAAKASLLRPELEPMAARMLVLGALNWAAEWWDPGRRSSLDTVVRTAQSLVRNGLSASDGSYRPAPGAIGQRRETETGGGPQLRVRWGQGVPVRCVQLRQHSPRARRHHRPHDPVRVYQQHATADALAPGRVEITAGRGSSVDSFPLFGYHLEDYDALYAPKPGENR